MPELSDVLAHHGVKGMKWGVVKKEDTSSGSGRSAEDKQAAKAAKTANKAVKRENKAQKFELRADAYQTRIDELNQVSANIRSPYRKSQINDQVKDLSKIRDRATKDAAATRNGKLTSNQKKVIIGASIVAAILIAKGANDLSQSGEGRRLATKGKAILTGKSFGFLKNSALADKSLTADQIQERVIKGINPEFGKIGTKMNCRRCTFAYEMRRRGYDVAATRTTNAHGQNVIGLMNATNGPQGKISATGKYGVISRLMKERASLVKNTTSKTPALDLMEQFAPGGRNRLTPHPESIFEALAKQPNGSRGELGVQWSMGGGHSMIYEILNGKAVIFDGQTGKKYLNPDEFFKSNTLAAAGFTRLDNLELNEDFLMRWLKNAG